MHFLLLLFVLLLGCSKVPSSLSKAESNTHKILNNQKEAQRAKEEYQKLQSSQH